MIIWVVLLVLCIYFLFIGAYLWAFLAFVGMWLVDRKRTEKAIGKVAEIAKVAGSAIGGIVGGLVGGGLSGLLSSPVGWVLIAAGIYFLSSWLGDDEKGGEDDAQADRSSSAMWEVNSTTGQKQLTYGV